MDPNHQNQPSQAAPETAQPEFESRYQPEAPVQQPEIQAAQPPQKPAFRPIYQKDPAYRAVFQRKPQAKPADKPLQEQPEDSPAVQPPEEMPADQLPEEQAQQQSPAADAPLQPAAQLKTNRSLVKFILLSIVTLGIYAIVVMSGISTAINTVASRYDNKKTMHFCLVALVFSWLTVGIVPLIWYHRISNRIGDEMRRRELGSDFSAKDFWLWGILGSLIIVGPFIYTHKLLSNMNKLAEDYNTVG